MLEVGAEATEAAATADTNAGVLEGMGAGARTDGPGARAGAASKVGTGAEASLAPRPEEAGGFNVGFKRELTPYYPNLGFQMKMK